MYTCEYSKGKKRGAAVVARQQLERSSGKKKAGSIYEETLEKIHKNRDQRNEKLRRIGKVQSTQMIKFMSRIKRATWIQSLIYLVCIDNSHLHPTEAMLQDDQALALSQG